MYGGDGGKEQGLLKDMFVIDTGKHTVVPQVGGGACGALPSRLMLVPIGYMHSHRGCVQRAHVTHTHR
jgi:hypothetical protein